MKTKTRIALLLGLLSWVTLLLALIVAILVEHIGFISIVRVTTVPLSILGIIVSRSDYKKVTDMKEKRLMFISFILSLSALTLIILSIFVVFVTFLPGLFA